MFKKSVSLILVLLMAIFMAIPAYATDESKELTDAQALAAAETGIAALIADEDADISLDEDLADKIIGDSSTPEEISRAISKFVFIEKSRVGELSDAIIADSKYSVKVNDEGKETVYVAISLIDHPEIYDARVFLSVVNKLAVKCDEFAAEKGVDIAGDNYDPMSYSFIAGELALHMMVADITEILGANSWNTWLKQYYDSAIRAELNIDEGRIARSFIEFVGQIITFVFDVLFA